MKASAIRMSPRATAACVALVIASLILLAPPEATIGGTSGLLTAFFALTVGTWSGVRARRAWQDRNVWGRRRDRAGRRPGLVSTGLLCALASVVGSCILIGNFRAVRVDGTISDKDISYASRDTRPVLTIAGHRERFYATWKVYREVRMYEQVHCSGQRPPLMRSTLTRCEITRAR